MDSGGFEAIDPLIGLHWRPPAPPEVHSLEPAITVWVVEEPCGAIVPPAAIQTVSIDVEPAAVHVVTVAVAGGPRPRVRSFAFADSDEIDPPDAVGGTGVWPGRRRVGHTCPTTFDGPELSILAHDESLGPIADRDKNMVGQVCPTLPVWPVHGQDARATEAEPPTAGRGRSGGTRIKPPRDVIKLRDRLEYLLQPPLEELLVQRGLAFPLAPFPYQYEGVAFLYPRHAAVLADEMGLGKTMQAITAIRLLVHRREIRRVLVVCPKPLVTTWRRELSGWAPELPVVVIEGTQERRRWQWTLADAPVTIANYELLHRDRDVLEEHHAVPAFDLVVLDESQRIKNRHAATSQAVRAIRSGRRWALTGTPVENSPEDLVGIFEFLAPGFLSPDMRPRRMGRAIGDHVLRRTKDQVLVDLPPKLFRDAELELSPEQAEAYRLAEEEGVIRLGALGREVTIQHVFELVLRLKQICNFDPATGVSAKLERLEADLDEVAQSGRKALVFSQWVQTLTRLRGRLGRFHPLEYHGRIPTRAREDVLGRFRDDPHAHVLLVSYGAGGVGLNLQMASYVFLFDRWWNPAVEDQAIHRVHRIGSPGPVTVTRFLMLHSIEERINRILQEKRELFDTIFSGAAPQCRLGLSQEELFGLFDLELPPALARAAA